LAISIYYYAFRYEPVNFKLSEVNIFVKAQENMQGVSNIASDMAKAKDARPGPGINNSISTSVNITGIPALTILHLSDFHLRKDRKGEKLFKFIQTLSSLKADFIFFTGDMVEKNENFGYLTSMLSGLKAGYGKYAVFGVHDYFNKTPLEFLKNMAKRKKEYKRQNDIPELISVLNSTGIRVLRNENVTIDLERKNHLKNPLRKIEIIGLEDSFVGKTDIEKSFRGLEEEKKSGSGKIETGVDSFLRKRNKDQYKEVFILNEENSHVLNNPDTLRISLTHTPDYDLLVDLSKKNVDIIMCGHTHGGQVRLPGIGALISGCNIKTRYTSGLFYFKKFILFITRGLGEGRYSPFRFYCQPEANFIKIFINS
jgi:predicted MPP superfamily phosphohydrolase